MGGRGGVVQLDKPLLRGWSEGGGVATEVSGEEMGEHAPALPPEMGVKMFESAQLNLFTPRGKMGGHPLAIYHQLLAGVWLGGDGVWGEDLSLYADVIGADGHGGVRSAGGEPEGVCRDGARHRLPAQVLAKARRNRRNLGPPAPAPPQPRDAFAKALGAIPPALDRQGTVC